MVKDVRIILVNIIFMCDNENFVYVVLNGIL